MSDTARATRARKEIKLAGQTLFARPLTYEEIGEYENAAISWFYRRLETIIAILPPDAQDARRRAAAEIGQEMSITVRKSLKDAAKDDPGAFGSDEHGWKVIDPDSTATMAAEAMARFNASLEGRTRYCWLSIRQEHPTLSLTDVAQMLMDEAVWKAAEKELNKLNTIGGATAGDKPSDGQGSEKKD